MTAGGYLSFRCGNGQCLAFNKRCDGVEDCDDDEQDCPSPCNADQFRCNDGKCIEAAYRCNRVHDCQDKTDEIGCVTTTDPYNRTTELACSGPTQFQCANRRQCVAADQRCDGSAQCQDGSDERDCDNDQVTPCPPDHIQCEDLTCVDVRRRCDGHHDCPGGVDEQQCRDHECEDWQMKCVSDGICIHQLWRCDGVTQCQDGTDEMDCKKNATIPTDGEDMIGFEESTEISVEETTAQYEENGTTEEDIFGFNDPETEIDNIKEEVEEEFPSDCNTICEQV